MQLLIAGDLVPTQLNLDLFNKPDVNTLLGKDLLLLWNAADIRVFNLEVPLVDEEKPISKCGPNLIAPTSSIDGIKALNPTLLTLANNHILDQDEKGLNSTINILDQHNIPYVGVGKNLSEASKPYILKRDGFKIGIYACAEHEFSIVTDQRHGANPFDPLESLDHIENLKNQSDFVIVLYHGGKEHYRYPSPYLQKVSRRMVEKGADLVICQHSHCIGCFENFQNSKIIYGQGNFIFNKPSNDCWKTSILVKLDFIDEVNIEYIPIVKDKNVVRLAEDNVAKEILDAFAKRSTEILEDGFVQKNYQEFANKNNLIYLTSLSGTNKWISRIDRRIFKNFFIKRKYKNVNLLAIQNYIKCEAHRELLLAGLEGGFTIERK